MTSNEKPRIKKVPRKARQKVMSTPFSCCQARPLSSRANYSTPSRDICSQELNLRVVCLPEEASCSADVDSFDALARRGQQIGCDRADAARHAVRGKHL